MQYVTSVSGDFSISHPKMTSDTYKVKKIVCWGWGTAVERGDSVTFFLLCCHLFNFFRAAAPATPLQRQPEVFVHLLQPSKGIKYKPKKRTAEDSLALMKLQDFCPSCDSVQHQWEGRCNKITRIRGTSLGGISPIELSISVSSNELSGSVYEMLPFFPFLLIASYQFSLHSAL